MRIADPPYGFNFDLLSAILTSQESRRGSTDCPARFGCPYPKLGRFDRAITTTAAEGIQRMTGKQHERVIIQGKLCPHRDQEPFATAGL